MPSDISRNSMTDISEVDFYKQAIDLLLEIHVGEVPHSDEIGSRIHEIQDQAITSATPGLIAACAEALDGKIPGVSIDSIDPLNESEILVGSLPVEIVWSFDT